MPSLWVSDEMVIFIDTEQALVDDEMLELQLEPDAT